MLDFNDYFVINKLFLPFSFIALIHLELTHNYLQLIIFFHYYYVEYLDHVLIQLCLITVVSHNGLVILVSPINNLIKRCLIILI